MIFTPSDEYMWQDRLAGLDDRLREQRERFGVLPYPDETEARKPEGNALPVASTAPLTEAESLAAQDERLLRYNYN